jgi:hypothetical protein
VRSRLAALAVLLALAACTSVYYKDFAVESQDRAYTGRAQFDDIRRYLISRKLRTIIETNDLLVVELEKEGRDEDSLQVRLTPAQSVEMTLTRRTAGENFSDSQLRRFRESFEARLRAETGHMVSIRLVAERQRPLTNLGF